jgi:ABC-type antimicrobial peptide transport system permease subunit
MRLSAVARKSISDLTRRRGRAVFAVAALALAVASVGLFALPALMSRAMNREIATNKLADATLTVKPLPLTAAQLQALASLPNVLAFEPRTTFSTRVYVGARRQDAFLIGKPAFATNTRLENAFAAHGLQMGTQIEYVGAANDRATYRGITTAITVLGLLIVAISMVALINTITMVVLERTREIGILRCIGAHARDVRRIFATEGLTVALAGWVIGIPLGFGLAHAIVALVQNVFNQHVLFTFPAPNIPLALIGTLILALLVMQIPLRRAVRFKPGEALRYA